MDSILTSKSILDEKSWVFFKIFRDPSHVVDWKSLLDWYHQTLIDVVKPVVENNPQISPRIKVVFFGFYGPTYYNVECDEKYKRQIPRPSRDVVFIKLRLSPKKGSKGKVEQSLVTSINANRNLVWNYETMMTYHVRNDLGNRYGSNTDPQTLQFIRYWDSACRYILSVVRLPQNWQTDVDVWGVPHLVNNSLGSYIRLSQYTPNPITCSNRGVLLYLETVSNQLRFSSPQISLNTPLFIARCPNCSSISTVSTNI